MKDWLDSSRVTLPGEHLNKEKLMWAGRGGREGAEGRGENVQRGWHGDNNQMNSLLTQKRAGRGWGED